MKALLLLFLLFPSFLLAQSPTPPARHESLKQEVQLAYQRGLNAMKKRQAEDGHWGEDEPVAFTALAMMSLLLDPAREPGAPPPAEAEKAAAYLLTQVKPDGGIYTKARANYNTSLALTALMLMPSAERQPVLLAARRFVIGQQNDFDQAGKTDNAFDGGIGYGTPKPGKPAHADLSNTHFALEALHYSEALLADQGDAVKDEPKLNFAAAIQFVQNCQNRPQTNSATWVSADPQDLGGFIYSPGETRGQEVKTAEGRTALRSYGSVSYAGMLSFIYAGLEKEDPRVQSVLKWLSENYTLEENPGLGAEGLYYYYHTMAKALAAAKVDYLQTQDAAVIDWRARLCEKLLSLQKPDGSWINTSSRWMESDSTLVTHYTLLALARCYPGL
jgi:squalene-hopene/tetraprenyl-beta-curcumene cyclase